MMYRLIFLLALIRLSMGSIQAQQPLSAANITTGTSSTGNGKLYHVAHEENLAARAIAFDAQTVTTADFLANINDYFAIPKAFTFVETESNTDDLGMGHHLLQQYHKGIPLEGLAYRVHEKNGFVTSANGKAIQGINIDVNTLLTEEQAFGQAVQYLQTKDTTFRSGKKLIVSKNFTFAPESFSVAYQFDIEVSLIERWRISIDARTGQVINKVSLVNTCLMAPPPQYDTGTGLTNYYGSKTIRVTKSDNGSSRLMGQTAHGGKIGTYDFKNKILLVMDIFDYKGSDFYSSDNTYNLPYQQPAVSVHWATEQAYEYFFTEHNRNSFDNNGAVINSYVHVEKDWDNAAWTRNSLVFGDGSNNNPLVELDVVSHEFTHGVTQYEADLTYQNEPGALNESFSDILAKAVEFSTFGDTATWQLGRHHRNGGIRDMSNPNFKGQPDTYQGDMWYNGAKDYGGVHYNSGVQNFWFYLLCEGGSGVNDRGHSYSVNSIGMDTATNIAYRNLTEYLISSSDYFDSRIGSLLATADLYGKNSSAYQEVDKAWDAVGVIDEPIITGLDLYDITATTVKFTGSLLPRGDTVTYHFEYGTTPAYGSSTSTYDYTGTLEGIITGLQSETQYYVRLVVTNENGSTYAAAALTTLSLAPLVKIKHTVDVTDTSAILYGQINPNSMPTSFYFAYGPTPAMGLVTSTYPLPDTTEFLNVSASVKDLQPRQTYYYKLIVTNDFASSETDSLSFFTALKPVITSFSPVTAIPGTAITITGKRFNPIPGKNWVSFGATRGKVLSSSATVLEVEVPAGASFGPISLLDIESGLTTESVQEFIPTFTGEFGKGDMQLRAAFDLTAFSQMDVYDVDGDGRPDIVGSHSKGITIFQNRNTGGDITNESFVQSHIPIDNSFVFQALADIDGNGLKDIVGNYQGAVRIYSNLSVPGYVFFGVPVDLQISALNNMQFKDFDNDGYIDIAGTSPLTGDSTLFTVFRNKSPKETLSENSFEQQYSKVLPHGYVQFLSTGDLDNDGTLDLMVSPLGTDYFSVLRNKSGPRVFEFEEIVVQDLARGRIAKYVAHDLNRNGWKDITSRSSSSAPGKIAVFESQGKDMALLKPIVVLDGHAEPTMQSGDINGDGKVDLLVGDFDAKFILLKNKTETGKGFTDSSFELIGHYGSNDTGYLVESNIILNDLNGDGRPEVINDLDAYSSPYNGHQLEIWQNSPNDCLDPSLISIGGVSRNSATVVLPPNTSQDNFEIEYVMKGSSDWRKVYEKKLPYLNAGTSYQVRVRAKCHLGFTNYHYIDFTTACVDLESFSISNVGAYGIELSASHLNTFEVQYSEVGKEEWTAVHLYADYIYSLLPGTTYDLRYRGRCDTMQEFSYTQFTTLCPTLSSLTVEDITFNKAVVNWTSSYATDVVLEYSTDKVTWTLIDETQPLFPLIPGKEYFVRGRVECTNIESDYIHTSFTTPCPAVSGLTVDAITPFSASVHWLDGSHTGSYTINYYSTGSNEVKTAETPATSFYLEGLAPGTQYTIAVAPKCIAAKSFVSTTFTTVCYGPAHLSAGFITPTTVELSWDANYSGPPYSIDYAIVGSEVWSTTPSTSTNVSLETLRPGTEYEARVYINCLSVTAPYATVRFQTSLYGETMFAPNPTDHFITIFPSKSIHGNHFRIYDTAGRKVADGKLLDYTIDLSAFSAGIYILEIEGEAPVKIIKQ